MWIGTLDVDDAVLDKLQWKHGVAWHEVEEACYGPHANRRAGGATHLLYGQTATGRYLLVVLAWQGRGLYTVVTARDMEREERRWYHSHKC